MNSSDDPDDSDPASNELGDFDRPLHEILGIEPNFAPDDLAPPVDEERLVGFVRGQLPPAEREEILCLIASFQPWLKAWAAVLRRHQSDGDAQS